MLVKTDNCTIQVKVVGNVQQKAFLVTCRSLLVYFLLGVGGRRALHILEPICGAHTWGSFVGARRHRLGVFDLTQRSLYSCSCGGLGGLRLHVSLPLFFATTLVS